MGIDANCSKKLQYGGLTLSSGSTTGQYCHCGAPVYAYEETEPYDADGNWSTDPTAWVWYWVYYCEWGHKQEGPAAELVQLSLLEV